MLSFFVDTQTPNWGSHRCPYLYNLVCTDNPASFREGVIDNPPEGSEIYFSHQVCSLFLTSAWCVGVCVSVLLWMNCESSSLHGITHSSSDCRWWGHLSAEWAKRPSLQSKVNIRQTWFFNLLLRPVLSHFHAFSKGLHCQPCKQKSTRLRRKRAKWRRH